MSRLKIGTALLAIVLSPLDVGAIDAPQMPDDATAPGAPATSPPQ